MLVGVPAADEERHMKLLKWLDRYEGLTIELELSGDEVDILSNPKSEVQHVIPGTPRIKLIVRSAPMKR